MTEITIKKAGPDQAGTLLPFSRDTFFTAFAPLNTEENMAIYAAKAFTTDRLLSELNNPDSEFYGAYDGDELIGYIKLNYRAAQTEFGDAEALEVERLYVSQAYQNRQVGQKLLQFAIDTGREQQLKYIWLGVWDQNHKAIRFYERQGFRVFGNHPFMLGHDLQTDLLMKKSF